MLNGSSGQLAGTAPSPGSGPTPVPPGPVPGQASPAAPPGPVPAPVLFVVRGEPNEAELAAVVAVLAGRARAGAALAAAAAPAGTSRSGWSDRSRLLRQPVVSRPGGWRASGLPS